MLIDYRSAISKKFDPIVQDIEKYVRHQVDAARHKLREKWKSDDDNLEVRVGPCLHPTRYFAKFIQAIFLVGGFGTNKYLFNKLTALYSPDVPVIQSDDAYVYI